MVAHPRKVVTFLRKEDILGSSALQNGVDNIAIIHRTGRDFDKRSREILSKKEVDGLMQYGNVLELCKNREFGSIERFIGLYYDLNSKRFTDGKEPIIRYGWGEEEYLVQKGVLNSVSNQQTDTNTGLVDYTEPRKKEQDLPFNTESPEGVPF